MLILAFIFVSQQDPSHQLQPYPLKFHPDIGACPDYFRFNLRRLISGFGTTSSERRLVSPPCREIKLLIYYTSIRQREHTHCCQLIFRPNGLWSIQPSLRMLTYHLGLLSNPVNPMESACKGTKKFRKPTKFSDIFLEKQEPPHHRDSSYSFFYSIAVLEL